MNKQVRGNCVADSKSCNLSQFAFCTLQCHGHIVTAISLIQWLSVTTNTTEKEIKMTTSFNRQNNDRTAMNNAFQRSNFAHELLAEFRSHSLEKFVANEYNRGSIFPVDKCCHALHTTNLHASEKNNVILELKAG